MLAGAHMKGFNDFMLRDLRMSQVQCDEFWTYVSRCYAVGVNPIVG